MKEEIQNLKKFIKSWNSHALIHNCAFTLKLHQFGIKYCDITKPTKILGGLMWTTPYGQLEDVGGILYLNDKAVPTITDIAAVPGMDNTDIDKIVSGDTIAIMWCVEDVQQRAIEIDIDVTYAQAKDILALLNKGHDANYGISWETIDVYLYDLERKNCDKAVHHGG